MKTSDLLIFLVLPMLVACHEEKNSEKVLIPVFRMQSMTSQQIEEAIRNGYTTAIFALASTEQHGPHMTTSADVIHGDEIVRRVADSIGHTIQCPTIPIGFSFNHRFFPGTITLSEPSFKMMVADYCRSLAKMGFEEIIIIPSHGGNRRPASEAIDSLKSEFADVLLIVSPTSRERFNNMRKETINRLRLDIQKVGGHGGAGETSMILSLAPEHVIMDKAEAGYIGDIPSVRERVDQEGWQVVAENGVIGDPGIASLEFGNANLEAWVRMTLEDIEVERQAFRK